MRWIVYETRCLVSGRIYVGVHRQDGDGFDGYLGSGAALRIAVKKHGVDKFERRTLEEFSTEAEAYAREAEIVTKEFCKRQDTYNMRPGGLGRPPHGPRRPRGPSWKPRGVSVRIDSGNALHHMWCNNGTWWIHYTFRDGLKKQRVRRSLRTSSLQEAIVRRDAALALLEQSKGVCCAA